MIEADVDPLKGFVEGLVVAGIELDEESSPKLQPAMIYRAYDIPGLDLSAMTESCANNCLLNPRGQCEINRTSDLALQTRNIFASAAFTSQLFGLVACLFLTSVPASAGRSFELPDPTITPGAISESVSQSNIGETICKKGWTRSIRPAAAYANRLKHQVMGEYGLGGESIFEYELDHLIPLELGGSPDDPANLWPERRGGAWPAKLKNDLESALNRKVCQGKVPLAEAQMAIRVDWIAAYHRYMSAPARGNPSAGDR